MASLLSLLSCQCTALQNKFNMLFKHHPDTIGLDISERSLKAIQFSRDLKNHRYLRALSDVALEKGVIEDGKIIKPDVLQRAIIDLIKNPKVGKFTTNYVTACLPDTKTFIKMIDIPPMAEAEMSQAIKWEAEHHIPLNIDETYWDWQKGEPDADPKKIPILLAVAPKDIVDTYTQAINQASLVTLALEVEAIPIVRCLIDEEKTAPSQAIIVVDIGASRTSINIYDKQAVQFSISIPISGIKMTSMISTALKITEEEAEKAKVVCGFDFKRCDGAMRDILKSAVDELIKRVNESVGFYKEHFPKGNIINRIMLCGGGANFKFIDQILTEATGIETIKANPWANLLPAKAPFKVSSLLSYTTAIGLALRQPPSNL